MVSLVIPCKLCRIGRRRGDILSYVNGLLSSGTSLRKASQLAYERYQVYFSKSSIALHKRHYLHPQLEEEQNHEFYSKSAKTVNMFRFSS